MLSLAASACTSNSTSNTCSVGSLCQNNGGNSGSAPGVASGSHPAAGGGNSGPTHERSESRRDGHLLWKGKMRITNQIANFDSVPPSVGGSDGTLILSPMTYGAIVWSTPSVGRWEAERVPSRDDCINSTGVNSLSLEEVMQGQTSRRGDAYCAITPGGSVLYIRVLSVGDASMQVDAITWDGRT